ncbi:MAG: hypothetical protein P1Q69_03370 [Candidatus Thorarchaeota archaeon]|nr:hypothetical protein [Candidatus Thorarchaeota archaeon]
MRSWKLAWRRMTRSKSTPALTLLVLLLGSALFVDSNLSLASTVSQAFEEASESVFVDMTVSLSPSDGISINETLQLVDAVQSIQSISSAEANAFFAGIAYTLEEEETSYNVTIVGVSNESEYFRSAFPSDLSLHTEGNKCYVFSNGPFLEYTTTNRNLIVNFTIFGINGFRTISIDTAVESQINLTRSQESITQGIFMDETDRRVNLEKNVIFLDYERVMRCIESDAPSDQLAFGFDHSILVSVNRASIDALQIDIATSNIQTIENGISNLVKGTSQHSVVQNHLGSTLLTIASWARLQSIEAQSLIISVVFVSCYLSFVAYRITHRRRRMEFGRLRTRGFPQKDISRADISESAILGIVAGLLGYVGGYGIASLGLLDGRFPNLSLSLESWFTPSSLSTLAIAVSLSLSISVIASYLSLYEIVNMSIVNQLRASDATIHSKSSRWNTFVGLMMIPALFQIIYDLAGFHVIFDAFLANSSGFASTIAINVIFMTVSWFRTISPILLTYGIATLLTRNQNVWTAFSSKLGSLFSGDIGLISTKSVHFDAKRTASLVFILSFFIVLSFVNPIVAISQYDHDSREIQARVGSDINLGLSDNADLDSAVEFLDTIEGIELFSVLQTSRMFIGYSEINIVAINRSSWVDTAYIEENWFVGLSPFDAMVQLETNSCLGEANLLSSFDSKVGDVLPLSINPAESSATNLTISGVLRVAPYMHDSTSIGSIMISIDTFSYLRKNMVYSTRLLVRLDASTNASEVFSELQESNMFSIQEFADEEINHLIYNPSYGGLIQIRIHSIIFAYMLSFIGMILISSTYANEMKHDLSIYYMRGFSRNQRTRTAYTSFAVYLMLSLVVGVAIGIPIMMAAIGNMNSGVLNIVPFNIVINAAPFLWLLLEVAGMLVSTYLIFWFLSSGKVKKM